MFKTLFSPVIFLGNFVLRWFISRSLLSLMYSLPTLILVTVVVWLVFGQASVNTKKLSDHYINAAELAAKNKEYAAVDLLWRKAALLTQNSITVRKGMAVAEVQRKNYSRAIYILEKYLAKSSTEDADVHLLLADIYLKMLAEKTTNEQIPLQLLKHLETVHRLLPQHQQTNLLLADYKLRTGNLEGAEQHLKQLIQYSPEHNLQLAKLYLLKKNELEAKKAARLAEFTYSEALKKYPENPNIRFALIQCEEILDDEKKMIGLIEEGIRVHTDKAVFTDILSQVALKKAAALNNDDPQQLMKKMELLQQALNISPRNPNALKILTEISLNKGEAGKKAREIVDQAFTQGYATPMMHLIMGTQLIQDKQFEQAKSHLDIALKQQPGNIIILNNLAWLLAHQQQPDLETALLLIDKAISSDPQRHETRDTRASIYFALEKWTDAIADWELALKTSTNKKEIHQKLAICYEKINHPREAELHKKAGEL